MMDSNIKAIDNQESTYSGYTLIENIVFDEMNLSKEEFCLYSALLRFYNRDKGYSYPSYRKLKRTARLGNDRTLIKAMTGLINKGYITKKSDLGVGTKYYLPTIKRQYLSNDSTFQMTGAPTIKQQEHLLSNDSIIINNTSTNKKDIPLNLFYDSIFELYPKHKSRNKTDIKNSINLWLSGKKKLRNKSLPKLNPYQIYEAVSKYLDIYDEERPNDSEVHQYIYELETFLNSKVLDYVEEAKEEIEAVMRSKYGDNWEYVEFNYIKTKEGG